MKFGLPFIIVLIISSSLYGQDSYWKKNNDRESSTNKSARIKKLDNNEYEFYSLDVNAFTSHLENAPSRFSKNVRPASVMSFPNEEGVLEKFSVVEVPLLSDELARKYPNIRTYRGYGIDNRGSIIRFTVSPQGVQTMTSYLNKPNVYTVPVSKGNNSRYISYRASKSKKDFVCLTESENVSASKKSSFRRDADDQILRTFRIAISTTAEYTNFWDDENNGNGDAKSDALAQVVSTLNRVNEIFEVDMAVNFQLVSGTEIIYDDASTDPYTIPYTFTSFGNDLQGTLTDEIGEANYDIGHLFHFGGNDGNANCIGCVCVDEEKGSGYSAHSFTDNDGGAYMTDFFDVDYVSHEIGHQMGAYHTHATAGNTDVNFEPGSGSTIMGYAGITGEDDVQDHSNPYFHYGSIQQILTNLATKACFNSTPITNNPPVADAGNDYTIPQGTAFVLRGAATDADGGDVLTYNWEQIDDGLTFRSGFGPTLTLGPLWRSRPPNTSPNRYMPVLSRILAGELTETDPVETVDNTSWETVSTVSRELNFALTVRDRSEANGTGQSPQSSSDVMKVTVDDTAGPFVVTSQIASIETWIKDETKTVTWNVAGTNAGSVNTPTVNILLSIDGGYTYPYTLASDVPNDGSHDITVPAISSLSVSTARVMVEGNNNIFFAINSTNFNAQNPTASVDQNFLSSFRMFPNPSNGVFNINFDTTDKDVSIQVFDLKGAVIKSMNFTNVGVKFSEEIQLNTVSNGLYVMRIINGKNFVSKKIFIK